ncbi:MAG: aldo/keto reductase [Pisciglobus halotolerans]|nr:aldo/keto reductase [Pisciglobus halotolerans]
MKTVQLANGQTMPIVGTGTNTYGKEGNQYRGELNGDFSALESAIEAGYRLIDAAVSYQNEAGIGKAIYESSVPREEFFITTKIPAREEFIDTAEAVKKTVLQSLKNFHTDYLDLYLIHHPIENKELLQQTWEVLESFVDEGKLKAIGVSNFDKGLVEEILSFARIKPVVNQIQSNPKTWNNELIAYCFEKGIQPEAWGPLSHVTEEQASKLAEIGKKYDKNWGQILLKYQIQRKVVVIPKSHNKNRQLSNLELFDFELNLTDVSVIEAL